VNVWSLHEADGSIVEEQGMRYETGGRIVPDWVADLIRIRKVEDLDVHIAHQKFPVFLLGETPSRRSAVLSIGQEAGYIRDMLVIHRERCRRDNDLVRNGERELIALSETLDSLKELDLLKDKLSDVRRRAGDLTASSAQLQRLEQRASQLTGLKRLLVKAQGRADITAKLPDAGQLAGIVRAVERARERERLGQSVLRLSRDLVRSRARLAALQSLPEAVPALENTASAQNMLKRVKDLRSATLLAQSRIAQVDEGLKSVQAEMARLVEETGGVCPTCGSPVKPETLLDHQAHSTHATTPSERLTA
jgi:prefoldin subunit 5